MKPKLFSSAGVAASDAPAHRGSCRAFARRWIVAFAALGLLSGVPALAAEIHGQVISAGAPIIAAVARLEPFDVVRVGGRKAGDPGSHGLGYPDAVLLLDS